MDYFSQKYSNSLFILSSDDKLWCQNNMKNLLITPINLTQGKVIYDHNYPTKNSWLDYLCPAKNYIRPWFIKL